MDVVDNTIGEMGKYQIFLCILIFPLQIPSSLMQMAIIFIAPPESYYCADTNTTKCPCSEPIFDRSIFSETIVMKWNLICSDNWLKELTQTSLQLGFLIGSFLFGTLSDIYGRKYPLLLAIVLQCITGTFSALVNNFWVFISLRFLLGVAMGAVSLISFVIVMEFIGHIYRGTTAALFHVPFNIGHLSLAMISYFCRNWQHVQLIISVPTIFFLSYYWILPESPRWLLAVRRVDRAVAIMTKAAKINNLPIDNIEQEVERYLLQKDERELHKGTLLDIFRRPHMRCYLIGMSIIWFAAGLGFYGISQYIGNLGGDIFVNVTISATVDFIGGIVAIPLIALMTRRHLVIAGNMVCIVCLLTNTWVPNSSTTNIIRVIETCIANMAIFIVFVVLYLYCSELFPTVVRSSAMGVTSMMARVGSMIAPFFVSLGYRLIWLPSLLFGIIPLVSIVVCLYLPETKGRELMGTLEEENELVAHPSINHEPLPRPKLQNVRN